MADSGLLEISRGDIKVARKILEINDEVMINISAYHIQQAIEKKIKWELNIKNIKYDRTHSIFDLCEMSEKYLIYIPEEIKRLAPIINDWATKPRYNSSRFNGITVVNKVLDITEEWILGQSCKE